MKVRGSLRKICESCKMVKRGRKNYVVCGANARHKQRQGFATLAAALSAPAPGAVPAPPTASPLAARSSAVSGGRSYAALLGVQVPVAEGDEEDV